MGYAKKEEPNYAVVKDFRGNDSGMSKVTGVEGSVIYAESKREGNPDYKQEQKRAENYGLPVPVRVFKSEIREVLERKYGSGYDKAMSKARQYFQEKMPAKVKVSIVNDKVVNVAFGPYNNKTQDPKLMRNLAFQKQKFGSLVNIPTNEDDDLERITEIIM